jgi:flavin-binding protein dodecin
VPVSKVNELIGVSQESFEEAAREVARRAYRTLRGVRALDVISKRARVRDGMIEGYEVRVRLRFEMAPETLWHE